MSNKLITPLCSRIFSNPSFFNDYKQLVRREFTLEGEVINSFSVEQIKRLVETAVIFSLSDSPNFQKISLKISILLLRQFKTKYKNLARPIELILSRLGDLPTIRHMYLEKDGRDYFSYFDEAKNFDLSFLKFPEIFEMKIFNQYEISSELPLNLTNFQSEVFHNLLKGNSVSFSAPTSAGKSFIVHNFIVDKLLKSDSYYVIYIVPTKSLIAEVQNSVLSLLKKLKINFNEVAIVNSAERLNTEQFENISKKVLVLTQERLQLLLIQQPEIKIDLLVVDEAQKVKEEERGVILEDVIGRLLEINQNLQSIFISPYIQNPEKFGEIFGLSYPIKTIATSKTPVGQNIFYIDLSKKQAVISLLADEFERQLIDIETIPLEEIPTAKFRIKSLVVNHLLKEGDHTLVYCDRPHECRLIATEISEDREDFELSDSLKEAIDFVKSHVHEEYYLSDHLQAGVGYHYGRMPQFVRFVVRELFDTKEISYLCCTSTLLEGVNLPAKNIVLYKPKSGSLKSMDKFSIKNLAGRAGRLGKDYYGNIYCVNISDWETGESTFDDQLENVESSTEKTLSLDVDYLIEHLQEYKIPEHGKKNVAAVATSLIIKQLRNPEKDFLGEFKKKYPGIPEEKIPLIKQALEKISLDVSRLDKEVILRNPSIDPRLQFDLYSYLRKPDNIIFPPEPDFENFYTDLEKIFDLLRQFIFKDKSEQAIKFYAFIANKWITQHSYKFLIENRINFLKNQPDKKKIDKSQINKIIDDIDEILESILKFEFTRGLRCYCDIVNLISEKRGLIDQFSMKLPDYLETGAHDPRVFLLLDLGLSRNSAISISNLMNENIKTTSSALDWIRDHKDKVKTMIHPVMYKELEAIMETR